MKYPAYASPVWSDAEGVGLPLLCVLHKGPSDSGIRSTYTDHFTHRTECKLSFCY